MTGAQTCALPIYRRDEFRASKIMLERARSMDNIEWLTPYVVDEFVPGENGSLTHARLLNTADGSRRELEIGGAFIAIGHEPQSELVQGQVETDSEGYVVTQGKSTLTSVPGVFAAGDLVDHTYRQAVTAAGTGCQAALDAEWYLRDTPPYAEAHWMKPDEVEALAERVAADPPADGIRVGPPR